MLSSAMAIRTRAVVPNLCVFCSFKAPRVSATSFLRIPVMARFRSGGRKYKSRSKRGAPFPPTIGQPPSRTGGLLLEAADRQRVEPADAKRPPISAGDHAEIYPLVEKALTKLLPPVIKETHYTQGWLKGNEMPAKQLREKFIVFADEVLSGFNLDDCSATGSFMPTPEKLLLIHSRGKVFEFFLMNTFLQYLGQQTAGVGDVYLMNVRKAADMRFPQEWFPMARQYQRTWYLHVGPTNSGKTYHALKRLEEAQDGIYAGPLRLLAHEIFERLNAKGIPCNLVTGDDKRIVSMTAAVAASTVEMVDLSRQMEVAILDEIQMIGDDERGWAWTQALLGVRAKEVHLCGEERTVDLIKRLAASVGDVVKVRQYNRLGPLETMESSFGGDLEKIEKGDCVVTFSRRNIFAMKREIESKRGMRCAVIYGGLPPETRSLQARLFNDPDSGYDVLVASDAVGMGLNLSIKRMIFESTIKWNGIQYVAITVPHIKQIAGRAGRFRVAVSKHNPEEDQTLTPLPAAPSVGLVTTFDDVDYKNLKYAMSATPKPIQTAGVLPSAAQIEEFSALFPPGRELSFILRKLYDNMRTGKLFHICRLKEQARIATFLEGIDGLTITEKLQFCLAPVGRDPGILDALVEMAKCVAGNKKGSILEIKALDLEILDIENPRIMRILQRLEVLHKCILLWLWLSWRFPATFMPRETGIKLKRICEDKIDLALRNIEFARDKRWKGQILPDTTDDDDDEGGGDDVDDEITLTNLPDSDVEDTDEDEDTMVDTGEATTVCGRGGDLGSGPGKAGGVEDGGRYCATYSGSRD